MYFINNLSFYMFQAHIAQPLNQHFLKVCGLTYRTGYDKTDTYVIEDIVVICSPSIIF